MDRAAILACPIMVMGVVMYAAPPNQVSEETPAASYLPRLGKVIVAVNRRLTHKRQLTFGSSVCNDA